MKAILQKVPTYLESSFVIQEFRQPYFNIPWHFHPEFELVLILKSEGKRFIGDNIQNFGIGDLVLVGSDLPHWYRNDAIYYENNKDLEAASIVIHFKMDFLGDSFFSKPEARGVKRLLQESVMGLEIHGNAREQASKMIKDMLYLNDMDKLLQFLSILNILSKSQEYITLSNPVSVGIVAKDSERINAIYEYVMRNFKNDISIQDASEIIHMCPAAFCRYFKKRTRKTFSYFLNEIKIGHACKMLIEKDLSIAEICYACGYNNISYFNRQFKYIKKITPQGYKQEYQEKLTSNRRKIAANI